MNSKQSSFNGMRFSVGRLKGIKKMIRKGKVCTTRFNDLISQLRNKGEVRYLVSKIFFVESRLTLIRAAYAFNFDIAVIFFMQAAAMNPEVLHIHTSYMKE
jgi:hypothetical protein